MKRILLLLAVFSVLATAAASEQIFVANRPFKGRVVGVGSEIKISLADLAKAMSLRAEQSSAGWTIGGYKIPVSEEDGIVWVRLEQLPSELVRVVVNKEFKTIDLYRAAGEGSDKGVWGGEGILVVFGTSWCPATKAMQPTLEDLSKSPVVGVVQVDLEAPKSPNFRDYVGYFEGDKVPYYVILDSSGRKLHSFFGFMTYQEMVNTLEKYLGSITGH